MLASGGGGLLCVRSNYGTGIMPAAFGAEMFMMADDLNTLPTSKPLDGGKERLRAILREGIPDLDRSIAGRTLEMGRRFAQISKRYPNIGKYISIYHPDLQGPMDICELMVGSALFTMAYDEPGMVKDLLERITDTYIAYLTEWFKIAPPTGAYSVHWSMLHMGRVMLRDDSAMNFSPAMYEEFIYPYDQRILDHFGGGAIHFCGRGDHFIAPMSKTAGLFAIAMSQPELNDMETIYRHTVDKDIRLIGFPRHGLSAVPGRDVRKNICCLE
jgi:hypothetical protein